MTDDKKKPEDEAPKAQAEDAKPSEDLSDDQLNNAVGGHGDQQRQEDCVAGGGDNSGVCA